jgi:multiple sugar transport system substrate-binding protein
MDTNELPAREVSRRRFLVGSAVAGIGATSLGSLLTACGGGEEPSGSTGTGAGGGKVGGAVTWGSWANPGEAERFRQYSREYQQKSGTKVTWQNIVGDYQAKLLTQLAGGAAPDAFYVGDGQMSKIIESGQLEDLTTYLNSADSPIKTTDVFEGLWQWCKGPNGQGIYGLPVDCNPKVFWFNKGLLQEAGVSQNPAQLFEAGQWNQAAITDMLSKLKGTGKRGLVLEGNWFDLVSWMTTFGGTPFDASGKAVFDTEPKSMAALTWLFDQVKAGNITYGGSLPRGQGVDALFYGGQLATIQYGRWILPNLKKLKNLQYDIAPMPSESGKDITPVAVYTAAMSVYKRAKDKNAALAFFGNYVSKDGQQSRLAGGGNAVPSVPGLESVVTEGNLPEHGKYFLDVAEKGYAIPSAIAGKPTVATNFSTEVDKLLKSGSETAESFAQKMAAFINQ